MEKGIDNISLIAAIGENNELGYDNDLIWRTKEDLQFFKSKTMGSKIVMGRKTLESLPGILPGRKHIVLSNTNWYVSKNIVVFKDINRLIDFIQRLNEEVFVIGGANIYEQFLDYANRMYLTEIKDTFPKSDVYFPQFDKSEWDTEGLGSFENPGFKNNDSVDNIKYDRVMYLRKGRK